MYKNYYPRLQQVPKSPGRRLRGLLPAFLKQHHIRMWSLSMVEHVVKNEQRGKGNSRDRTLNHGVRQSEHNRVHLKNANSFHRRDAPDGRNDRISNAFAQRLAVIKRFLCANA